ncbi:LPXTG cell wall anchor domain-containing protein [Streptomyces sp. NPDC059373]
MTSHRPPVFIAAAAATVLGALYFVPNASASAEHVTTKAATTVKTSAATAGNQEQLADTGSADTTPYLIGGTAFLGMGAALLVNATRRSREAEAGPPA